MNRRNFLALTGVPALAAITPNESQIKSLTYHDKAIIESVKRNHNNLVLWKDITQKDADDRTNMFAKDYENSILRHITATQPITGPTSLMFVRKENSNSPMERQRDFYIIHGSKPNIIPPTSFKYIDVITVTSATRISVKDSYMTEIEREVIRTMHYLSTSNFQPLPPKGLKPTYIIANPKDIDKIDFPNVYVSEFVPENEPIAGIKTSEYDAPMFMAHYQISSLTTDEIKTRYACVANPCHHTNCWRIKI